MRLFCKTPGSRGSSRLYRKEEKEEYVEASADCLCHYMCAQGECYIPHYN